MRKKIIVFLCAIILKIARALFSLVHKVNLYQIKSVETQPFETPFTVLSINPANLNAQPNRSSSLSFGRARRRTRSNAHYSALGQQNAAHTLQPNALAPAGPKNATGQQRTITATTFDSTELNAYAPLNRRTHANRVSMETPGILSYGLENYARFSKNEYWRNSDTLQRFNSSDLGAIDIDELAELLADMSPEVSAALWYVLLSCNSGYTIKALSPKTKKVDERAQKVLDTFLHTLGNYNGTLNVFFDKLFMCLFLRGSICLELVLDDAARQMMDIAAPDTKTLSYRRTYDPIRGQIWDFGQWQMGTFVSFKDEPTIKYVPLHPFPARIEGRSPITASFFVSIFLMSVLRDLKRVIQQQGYMRMDLTIELDKLKDSMPQDAQDDPKAFKRWADDLVASVTEYYSTLEPDDAFVHTNATTINKPAGTASGDALRAMDALFTALERMSARALKTMPIFMGIREGANAATSNREFEFYQKGNETLQRIVESAMSSICEEGLQAQGVVCEVEVKFAQMRASEELRDEQLLFLKAQRARYLYDCGIIGQDEMATIAIDKDKADQAAPRAATNTQTGNIATLQTDPSSLKFVDIANMMRENPDMFRTPTAQELENSMKIWKLNAPDDAKHLIDAGIFEQV